MKVSSLWPEYRPVSSAYSNTLEGIKSLSASLIYNRNNEGPIMLPWGIPHLISISFVHTQKDVICKLGNSGNFLTPPWFSFSLYIAGLPLRSCRTIGAPSVQGSAHCGFFVYGSSMIRTHVLVITMRKCYRCATLWFSKNSDKCALFSLQSYPVMAAVQ